MGKVLADAAAIRNVSAYITTFPPHASESVTRGDIARGEELWVTCGACHGMSGEGNYATRSPRLAGQDDWYIKRQLETFRQGIRGSHPDEWFGPQMVSMSRMLRNEQDINDIVAFINTLPTVTNQVAQATEGGQ